MRSETLCRAFRGVIMNKSGFLALLAAGIFATCGVQAQQQPWIVKGGLGYMMPKNNPGNVDFGDGKVWKYVPASPPGWRPMASKAAAT